MEGISKIKPSVEIHRWMNSDSDRGKNKRVMRKSPLSRLLQKRIFLIAIGEQGDEKRSLPDFSNEGKREKE